MLVVFKSRPILSEAALSRVSRVSALEKKYRNVSRLVTKSNLLAARLIPSDTATLKPTDMVKLKLKSPIEVSNPKKKWKDKEVIEVELARKKQKFEGTLGVV